MNQFGLGYVNGRRIHVRRIPCLLYTSVNVGDIEVDPCTVKAIDGGYAFEGQQNLDLVQPLGNCPVSISGTVKDVYKRQS